MGGSAGDRLGQEKVHPTWSHPAPLYYTDSLNEQLTMVTVPSVTVTNRDHLHYHEPRMQKQKHGRQKSPSGSHPGSN